MILNSTYCKALLGISTAVNTYDQLIDIYIPVVSEDLANYAGHRFHDAYHWLFNDYMVFKSSDSSITISNSTFSFYDEFTAGDTIDILNAYKNKGYKTIATIASSHSITVTEPIISENSTTYQTRPYLYKCFWESNIQRIASKMVYWNCKNSDNFSADIRSESYGGHSVTYGGDSGAKSFGMYPDNLLTGIKRKAGSW